LPIHRQNFPRPLSKLNSLAVYGPGLIGGSILRACGKCFPDLELRVWGRSREHLEEVSRALHGRCFTSTDAVAVATGAEGVIFCTPVDFMEELAQKIAHAAGSARWFTDAGSVKGSLVLRLKKILGHRYLGAHPMAGSEKTGFANATESLFQNSVCILTPTAETADETQREVADFWRSLGCRITESDPFVHDQMVAQVSHLPHLAAAALVQAVGRDAFSVAGPGFRDSTRIAMGDAEMWAGILLENREAVLDALLNLETILQSATGALRSNDRDCILELLASAAEKRSQIF
jgi:prephenate dehydrogenase